MERAVTHSLRGGVLEDFGELAGLTGWTLAELAVLNRHRRLAM